MLAGTFALLALGACGADDATTEPEPASVPTTPAIELFVTEDRVHVGVAGLYDDQGATLLAFDAGEQDCIRSTAGLGLPAAGPDGTSPVTVDDPDDEQVLAEAVVACVDFARLRAHVLDQLADQPALDGVDGACIDEELDALRTQPDVVAAVLRGDESGRPVIARIVAENCTA